MDTIKGRKIIGDILDGTIDYSDGIQLNDLLREFQRGLAPDELVPLLNSSRESALKSGTWVASELGVRAHSILDVLEPLLTHSLATVRYDVISAFQACAEFSSNEALATLVSMLEDGDSSVRWKAMSFLVSEPTELLERAHKAVHNKATHSKALKWLLSDEAQDQSKVTEWMRDSQPLVRKYGAIAASRMAHSNPAPLQMAAESEDDDVRRFASSELNLLPFRATRKRRPQQTDQ